VNRNKVWAIMVMALIFSSCGQEIPHENTPYVSIGTYRDKLNNDLTKYCAILSDANVRCVDIPVVK
jgi:hypothetical protein